MNPYIPGRLNDIEEYKPGAGTYPVRLDANESPYPPPPEVLRAFSELVGTVAYNRYPDPAASALVAAFADTHGLPPDCVVAGNGSDELISVMVNGFLSEGECLLVTAPDFSMYRFYGDLRGVRVVALPKGDGHGIDFEAMLATVERERPAAVIFSNPCNPTGLAYGREVILDFVSRAKTLVVVDEAYAEFCEADCSVLADAPGLENLIVLRTLSKAYGLAALRVGFAAANVEIASALRKVKSPYNVGALTQCLALAALQNRAAYAPLVRAIVEEKKRLQAGLCALAARYGLEVYHSDTNFVLLKCGGAEALYGALCAEGVKVRCMPPYLRITAGTPAETDRFLAAFAACLEKS